MLNADLAVLTANEINVIFCRVPDLHRAHDLFVLSINPLVESWNESTEVAEAVKLLVSISIRFSKIVVNWKYCFSGNDFRSKLVIGRSQS